MGARDFQFVAQGLSAVKAYNEFVEEQMYQYGQNSGFRMKGGVQEVSLPANIKTKAKIEKYINELLGQNRYGDKYGPAFYIVQHNTGKKEFDEVVGSAVVKAPQKKAKEWKTIFVIEYYQDPLTRREEFATQALALEKAKQISAKGIIVEISVEKKLVSGTKLICRVEPKTKKVKKSVNTYYFFGFVPE